MDFVSVTAVIISGILIFTTIQAQDFPDVEGDKALGRMTFPIYAPMELSRAFTLFWLLSPGRCFLVGSGELVPSALHSSSSLVLTSGYATTTGGLWKQTRNHT